MNDFPFSPATRTHLSALPGMPDLVERVHRSLLDAICSGTWPPGTRLTQETVAEQLGVSRQPVLQAFRLLAREGLLLETPNRKGVLVAPLDAAFVAQLYEVRGALDALAARTAASRPRPDLAEAGARLLERGREAARHGEVAPMVEADLAFHRFVYEAAGNPVLTRTADVHWHHTRRAMAAYLSLPASFDSVWREHAEMLEAIVAGDAARAELLSRAHAQASVQMMLARTDRAPADEPPRQAAG